MNRDLLLQNRILYPSVASNLTTPLCTIFQENPSKHIANRMANLTAEEIDSRRRSYLESLDTELSSFAWSTCLLSAEGVSNLSASEITKLREWGEKYATNWTILVCVRHPVSYVRSVIQQLMKGGDTLQQLYSTLPLPNYRGRISNAISVFGRENVRVFDFESAIAVDGGLIKTFIERADLPSSLQDSLVSQAVRDNESLSLEAVLILDALNRQRPMFVGGTRSGRRSGQELAYLSRIRGQKFDVPDHVKRTIRMRTQEDVAWLNETFELNLYDDIRTFRPYVENQEPSGHSDKTLSDPAIDTIAEIISELVTAKTFYCVLEGGRAALARGDLERAKHMFQEAMRLDPDAQQPRRLLRQVSVRRQASSPIPSQGRRLKLRELLSRVKLRK